MTVLQSWRIYESDREVWWPSSEIPLTTVVDHPYLVHNAPLAIYNGVGSNVKLHVTGAAGAALITANQLLPTVFNVSRITAHTGGEALTAQPLDTAISALPAQVTAAKYASVTATTIIRRMPDFPRNNIAQSRGLAELSTEFSRRGTDPSTIWDCGYHDSGNQCLTLREGEGVCLTPPAIRLNCGYGVCVIFKTAAGTYIYDTHSRPKYSEALFSLMNGSGSGVIISIYDIQVYEIAEDSLPYYSVEIIDGILDAGEAVTPAPMDSTNTSLPAQVQFCKRGMVSLCGSKNGAFAVMATLSRAMIAAQGNGPAASMSFGPERSHMSKRFNTPIVLDEGRGLAIINRAAGKVGEFEFSIDFAVEPGAATGGGGGSYTF